LSDSQGHSEAQAMDGFAKAGSCHNLPTWAVTYWSHLCRRQNDINSCWPKDSPM